MQIELKKNKSVMVGMSGGVDSSVVAAILHKEGWNVIGVTLQLYKQEEIVGKTKTCCGSKDTHDAKMVCVNLGIPHYVINYQSEFKKDVIDEFINDYKNGKTPIPCVRCNQSVKFRDMLKVANDLGIEYIATGHYAQRIEKNGEIQMHKAIDSSKDQTYFLFATTREQFSKTLFPLGGYTKMQTREIARELGVSVSEKKESQDICFIPDGDYGKFLIKNDASFEKQGNIILKSTGEIIGTHNGAAFYTSGQRRGIGVGGNEFPLYVINTDVPNNIVYVDKEDLLFSDKFIMNEVNFLSNKYEKMDEFTCNVVVRALKPEVTALVKRISKNEYEISLKQKTRAITAGQACVMYDATMVIGGGFIL